MANADTKKKGRRIAVKDEPTSGEASLPRNLPKVGEASDRSGLPSTNGDAEPTAPTPASLRERMADPALQAASAESNAGAPTSPDLQTRELLRRLREQEKVRLEIERREADDLRSRAKEIANRVRSREKVRQAIQDQEKSVAAMAPELGFDPNRPITEIPPLRPGLSQVEFTTVQEGRSFIRIVYDAETNLYEYEVIEPTLSITEGRVLEFLRDTLVRTLDARQGTSPEEWERSLTEAVERAILDHSVLVDAVSKQRLLYHLIRDFLGFGPIEVFMRDPLIEDISCDGPGIPLYLFHRQYESIKTNVVFPRDVALDGFVIRLAQRSGKHISIADPLLDATLPDGSRLQCSLSKEVTTRGSSFTIRKFRTDPLTPPDLVRLGTLNAQMAAYFWLAMEQGSSLLYAGGTASGKTTTLNAVSVFIPPQKKIVSIEDTREIQLSHENWIAGLTRSGFGGEIVAGKQAGTIDMYKLLEAALRQRPEYLIVGEVRGPEAVTLFQAMATGHATYSTMHADSVTTAVYRLENEPINVPRIMLQTLDAVAVQLQVRIKDRLARRIKEVTEIVGIDPGTGDLLTNQVFEWDASKDEYRFLGRSQIFEDLEEKLSLTREQVMKEWENRTLVIQWLVDKGIRKLTDVAPVISEYYRRPENVLSKARDAQKAKRGKV